MADKTEICLDGELRSVWLENNMPVVFTKPLNKLLGNLSRYLVSNIEPMMIFSVSGQKAFSKQFYEFLWAAEYLSDKNIAKVSIHDGRREEMAIDSVRGSWKSYYQNISDVLNRGAELAVKPEEALRTMQGYDAAMKSAGTGAGRSA